MFIVVFRVVKMSLELKFTEEDRDFFRYLTPFYGLYAVIKNREKIEGQARGKFGDLMLGIVPLNMLEAIGLYKFVDYVVKNPNFFYEAWQAIGDIGRYAFST